MQNAQWHSALNTLTASVRSIAAYVATLAYIAVAGPLGLLFATVFRWKRGLYALGHAGVRIALSVAGIRYRVSGRQHIPAGAVVGGLMGAEIGAFDGAVLGAITSNLHHVIYRAQ